MTYLRQERAGCENQVQRTFQLRQHLARLDALKMSSTCQRESALHLLARLLFHLVINKQ